METLSVAGKPIELDSDGHLARREDWNENVARELAVQEGIPELTRPEVLAALEAIIHGFGRVQATMDVNKSVFEIVKDLNSKDARRGIAIIVEFLKVVGAQSVGIGAHAPQQKTER